MTDKIVIPPHQELRVFNPKNISYKTLDLFEDEVRLNDGGLQLIKPEAIEKTPILSQVLKFELINTPYYKKAQDLVPKEKLNNIINRLIAGDDLEEILFDELDSQQNSQTNKNQWEVIAKMVKSVILSVRENPKSSAPQMSLTRAIKEATLFQDYQKTLAVKEKEQLKVDEKTKRRSELRNLLLELEPEDALSVNTKKQKQFKIKMRRKYLPQASGRLQPSLQSNHRTLNSGSKGLHLSRVSSFFSRTPTRTRAKTSS